MIGLMSLDEALDDANGRIALLRPSLIRVQRCGQQLQRVHLLLPREQRPERKHSAPDR